MVKPLAFKGDKKAKKRKRAPSDATGHDRLPTSHAPEPAAAAATAAADDDEHWVCADTLDDISGPVMLVLPGARAACLAADALGAVFASPVENMVDDEPATAEPHDVRQVWIAHRIAATPAHFTFKGHHGKYLGCERAGALSAARDAVGPEETFALRPHAAVRGAFDVDAAHRRYLARREDGEVWGDAEAAGEMTAVRVRMQARFKPKLQVEKTERVRAKISRQELEAEVGRRLEEEEVKRLKKARREGNYHEAMLDVKVKGKHDKFA